MSLQELAAIRAALAAVPDRTELAVAETRVLYEQLAAPQIEGDQTQAETVDLGGMAAEFSTPPGAATDAAILYLHGGGYCLGSLNTHRRLVRDLARAAQVCALAVDYRLAPEHPFPAAVEDAVAGYRHLIGRGIEPRKICIAGDSAGGGLTIATLVALRDQNLPLPGAAFCISPWVELANNLPSMTAKNDVDPMVTKPRLDQMAAIYALDRPLSTALLSPLHADLTGLPPVLIHVGSAETLLDDSVRLAGVLGAAAVETRLEIWPEMIHVWHFFAGLLSEGRDAITAAGTWIGSKIAA